MIELVHYQNKQKPHTSKIQNSPNRHIPSPEKHPKAKRCKRCWLLSMYSSHAVFILEAYCSYCYSCLALSHFIPLQGLHGSARICGPDSIGTPKYLATFSPWC